MKTYESHSSTLAQSPQIDFQIQDQDTYEEHLNVPDAHGAPLLDLDECVYHCSQMNKRVRSCNHYVCLCTSENFDQETVIPFLIL